MLVSHRLCVRKNICWIKFPPKDEGNRSRYEYKQTHNTKSVRSYVLCWAYLGHEEFQARYREHCQTQSDGANYQPDIRLSRGPQAASWCFRFQSKASNEERDNGGKDWSPSPTDCATKFVPPCVRDQLFVFSYQTRGENVIRLSFFIPIVPPCRTARLHCLFPYRHVVEPSTAPVAYNEQVYWSSNADGELALNVARHDDDEQVQDNEHRHCLDVWC